MDGRHIKHGIFSSILDHLLQNSDPKYGTSFPEILNHVRETFPLLNDIPISIIKEEVRKAINYGLRNNILLFTLHNPFDTSAEKIQDKGINCWSDCPEPLCQLWNDEENRDQSGFHQMLTGRKLLNSRGGYHNKKSNHVRFSKKRNRIINKRKYERFPYDKKDIWQRNGTRANSRSRCRHSGFNTKRKPKRSHKRERSKRKRKRPGIIYQEFSSEDDTPDPSRNLPKPTDREIGNCYRNHVRHSHTKTRKRYRK